tara:strand:- start:2369 stop:2845 length:477 start_codon:yes stop_codon:yes gene_type:complete
MDIHPSYSKKELIEIIDEYNLNIDIELSKFKLKKELQKYNLDFLYKENENKKLNINEKNDIIKKAKKLISYVKCGCIIENSIYNNFDEIIFDVNDINDYGEISSVRRAVNLINYNLNLNIPLYIDSEKHHELKEKQLIKKKSEPQLLFKSGKYKVRFE